MSAYSKALKMAVPSLFKGVSNMFNKPPQRKVSSDTTALLNKQRQIAKEGLYGQDVKNEIMTDVKQADKINALASASEISQGIEDVRYTNALNRFQRRDDIVSSLADAGTVFSTMSIGAVLPIEAPVKSIAL